MIEKCRGRDLNILDMDGRSLLCCALSKLTGFDMLNFMLESGCSWNACKYHASPWLCVTNNTHLTNSLVQMLIDVEAKPNDEPNNEPLLHQTFRKCTYEISAIQLMIDKEIVEMGKINESGGSEYGNCDLHAVRCRVQPEDRNIFSGSRSRYKPTPSLDKAPALKK